MDIKLGICAIIKSTPDYLLKEWIDHHFNIGVHKIIVVVDVNSSKLYYDDRVEYIYLNNETRQIYVNTGNKYSPIESRGTSIQVGTYNIILEKYRNELDWLACIDDDEFLNLNVNDLKKYNDETCVLLPWKMMFTNDVKCQYNLNNYITLPPYEKYVGNLSYIKTIVNTKNIWKIHSVHYGDYCGVVMDFPELTKKYYENRDIFYNEDIQLMFFNKSKNYIKHYKFRSFQEWIERVIDRTYLVYDTFTGISWNQNIETFLIANPYYSYSKNMKIDDLLNEIDRNDVKYTPYYPDAEIPVFNIVNTNIIYNHYTNKILNIDEIEDIKNINKNFLIIDYIKTFNDEDYPNCTFMSKNIFLEWLRFYNRKNKTKLNEFETINRVIKIMFPSLSLNIKKQYD